MLGFVVLTLAVSRATAQLHGAGSDWPLSGSLFAGEDPFVTAYGNEPTQCRNEAGETVTCQQINLLAGIWMNSGPTATSFAMHSSLHIAAHYINQEQYLLPGYEIVLHSRDTGWSAEVKDKLVADELLNSTKERRYAGTISSFNLDGGFVYLMNKLNMPLLSGTISQQMSDADDQPGVVTPVNHAGHILPAMKKLFNKCSWSHLGVIYDPNQFHYEADYFQSNMASAGYDMDFHLTISDVDEAASVVASLKSSRTRVLAVFGEADMMVYLVCEMYLQNVSRVMVTHWPAIPWWLSYSVAQDPTCQDPSVLLGVLKNNYIGFYPTTMESGTPTEPLTCHPNQPRDELQSEIMVFMTQAKNAAGGTFGVVPHMAGGADLACLMTLYLKEMLFERNRTVDEITSYTPEIYQEYMDWAWPRFQGLGGDIFFTKYYGSKGQFSGGRETSIEIIQITGTDYLKSPSMGASQPWDVGNIYPDLEMLQNGTLVTGFLDVLTFEDGSECPANEFEECDVGQELLNGWCVDCSAGRFLDSETGECADCSAGFYQSQSGQTSCLSCQLGEYAGEEGMSACLVCPAGSFRASGVSATHCALCEEGTYSDEEMRMESEGMAHCSDCPLGSYQSSQGSSSCTVCPHGLTTAEKGSQDSSACVCPEGSYYAGSICVACPEGMSCAVGASALELAEVSPQLEAGYWASVEEPLSPYVCDSEIMCPGGTAGICAAHSHGQACAHCDDGYILVSDSCVACTEFEKSYLMFPFLPLIISPMVVLLVYRLSRSDVHSWKHWHAGIAGMGFVLLNHYQLLGLLQVAETPGGLSDTLSMISFTSDFLAMFKPPCVGFSTYLQELIIKSLLPVIGAVCFALTALASIVLAKLAGKPDLQMKQHRIICSYFTVIFTFFSAIAQACFTVTSCGPNPSGKSTLLADRSVTCFEEDWYGMLSIGVVAILFWCVGFGALFVRAILKASSRWNDPEFRLRWKFLFLKFRPGCFFFSIVIVSKGIFTNIGFIFFSEPLLQVYWVVGCLAVYCFFVAAYTPWRVMQINFVDMCAHLCLIFLGFMITWFIDSSSSMDSVVNVLSILVAFLTLVICTGAAIHMIASQTANAFQLRKQTKIVQMRSVILGLAGLEAKEFNRFMERLIDYDFRAFAAATKAAPEECGHTPVRLSPTSSRNPSFEMII